mmetsp:Transcript_6631/g.20189  ORF Transcript_6631/g.20189 Transcript_6631/m.20189 type:complete len:206 (+) Transcript_6631:86-703(+)|eukprot:CAMPEP_0174241268 /NCGR_PEP_ID=MMETSP0417-20130205/22529_1 /TAXON_ID=242541 /ORGANISM="Mayorella sp, Strain BSH-02190019" /LENGTH=205 /DNA_ID=CAMNT_0015320483 /DNA_START=85 /DNA_END=702 /DNA_ORIENTATION=-
MADPTAPRGGSQLGARPGSAEASAQLMGALDMLEKLGLGEHLDRHLDEHDEDDEDDDTVVRLRCFRLQDAERDLTHIEAPNWRLDNEELDRAVLSAFGVSSAEQQLCGYTVDVLSADGYEFSPSSRLSTVYRHGGLFVVSRDTDTDTDDGDTKQDRKTNVSCGTSRGDDSVHADADADQSDVQTELRALREEVAMLRAQLVQLGK